MMVGIALLITAEARLVITTIPKQTLAEQIAPLAPAKLAAVERALRFALGLQD